MGIPYYIIRQANLEERLRNEFSEGLKLRKQYRIDQIPYKKPTKPIMRSYYSYPETPTIDPEKFYFWDYVVSIILVLVFIVPGVLFIISRQNDINEYNTTLTERQQSILNNHQERIQRIDSLNKKIKEDYEQELIEYQEELKQYEININKYYRDFKRKITKEMIDEHTFLTYDNRKSVGVYAIILDDLYYIGSTNAKSGFISRINQHKKEIRTYIEDVQRLGKDIIKQSNKYKSKDLYPKFGDRLISKNLNENYLEVVLLKQFEYGTIGTNEVRDLERDLIVKYNAIEYGLNVR